MNKNKLRVTQKRSAIGEWRHHRLVLKGMGLNGIGRSVELQDTPEIRGMIMKVQYLVDVVVFS